MHAVFKIIFKDPRLSETKLELNHESKEYILFKKARLAIG